MNISPAEITGLILAGGQGRRVGGQDKGWLRYQGDYLIAHQVNWLSPQVSQLMISANRNVERYQTFQLPVLTDPTTEFKGPLQGVYQALANLSSPWLYVQPVDTPQLPKNLIEKICAGLSQSTDSKLIYLASKERDHYLNLLIHESLKEAMLSFLQAGNARVRDFIRSAKGTRLQLDIDESCFKNLNEMEQFKALD